MTRHLHEFGFFAVPLDDATCACGPYLGIDRKPYQTRCGLCGYVLQAGDRHGIARGLDGEIVCVVALVCADPDKSATLTSITPD